MFWESIFGMSIPPKTFDLKLGECFLTPFVKPLKAFGKRFECLFKDSLRTLSRPLRALPFEGLSKAFPRPFESLSKVFYKGLKK